MNTDINGSGRDPIIFSQAPLHPLKDFTAWRAFLGDCFPGLECRAVDETTFQAHVHAYRISGSLFSVLSTDAGEISCPTGRAEGAAKLIWPTAGYVRVEQDERCCRVGIGEVTLLDSARPYRIEMTDRASLAVLVMPYDALPSWGAASPALTGTRLTDGATTSAALGALMALTRLPHEMVATRGEPVFRAVQWMISTALLYANGERDGSGNRVGQSGALRDDRLDRAKRYVLDNIADLNLSADDIASALCMSRRSLYMLFKDHQLTPSKMIQNLRLKKALQVLSDPTQENRKIVDVAFDLGFGNCASFSRVFKTHFGISPSECRQKRGRQKRERERGYAVRSARYAAV